MGQVSAGVWFMFWRGQGAALHVRHTAGTQPMNHLPAVQGLSTVAAGLVSASGPKHTRVSLSLWPGQALAAGPNSEDSGVMNSRARSMHGSICVNVRVDACEGDPRPSPTQHRSSASLQEWTPASAPSFWFTAAWLRSALPRWCEPRLGVTSTPASTLSLSGSKPLPDVFT